MTKVLMMMMITALLAPLAVVQGGKPPATAAVKKILESKKNEIVRGKLDAMKNKKKKTIFERNLQQPVTINCNNEAINRYITGELQGGTCEEFAAYVGGVELCKKYENITSVLECAELSENLQASLTVGDETGVSVKEECEFFVQHLQPHVAFIDLDPVMPVFGSGFDFPSNHSCGASEEHDCIVAVHYANEDRPLAVGETFPPTPAPFTEVTPCTQCDYSYDSDDVCFDAPCDVFHCAANDTGFEEETDVATTRLGPESVHMCFKQQRSELYSFIELRQGGFYGCFPQEEEKLFITEFHVGVSNVRKLEFRLGEEVKIADINDEALDFCELKVDDVKCNSCSFCEVNHTAHLDLDCTNIVPDAKTSCHSEADFLFGIAHKLLILEEGATAAPTNPPTPPTNPPTEAPTVAPVATPEPVPTSGVNDPVPTIATTTTTASATAALTAEEEATSAANTNKVGLFGTAALALAMAVYNAIGQ